MKKLILGAFILASTFAQTTFAQNNVKEIFRSEVPQTVVPQEVLTKIKTDFPKHTVTVYTTVPVEIVDYTVILDDIAKSGKEHKSYQIDMTGKDNTISALYDYRGNLVHYRQKLKDTAIPLEIATDITARFPGYAFSKDHEKIVINSKAESTVRYKILITDAANNDRMHLIYDGNFMLLEKVRPKMQ